MFLQTVIETVY